MRTFALTALLVAVASWASAQTIAAAPTHSAPSPRPSSGFIQSLPAGSDLPKFRHAHHRFSPFASPFFFPGIFPDSSYPDNPPPPSGSPPAQPDLLLQLLSGLSATQEPAKPDPHALLIELQGDRYVSLTNAATGKEPEPTIIPRSPKSGPPKSTRNKAPRERPAAASELQPVTLLFRDGHREDVRDYTIAGGVIYARADYYHDGYWNKKIDLSALDLPETQKFNESQGVHFTLPNSPNEVITRP